MLRKNSQVRKLLVSFLNEVRQNSSDITKDRVVNFLLEMDILLKDPLIHRSQSHQYKPRNAKPQIPVPGSGKKTPQEFNLTDFLNKPLNIQKRELNLRIANRNRTFDRLQTKGFAYSEEKRRDIEKSLENQDVILSETGMVRYVNSIAVKNWE